MTLQGWLVARKYNELVLNTKMNVHRSFLNLEYGHILRIWRESQAAERETA